MRKSAWAAEAALNKVQPSHDKHQPTSRQQSRRGYLLGCPNDSGLHDAAALPRSRPIDHRCINTFIDGQWTSRRNMNLCFSTPNAARAIGLAQLAPIQDQLSCR